MAQHVDISHYKQKKIRDIEDGIRRFRSFGGSLKYEELPGDYKETPDDKVYVTYRTVPESIVWGGKATFEVHTKPDPLVRHHRIPTKIYLVA